MRAARLAEARGLRRVRGLAFARMGPLPNALSRTLTRENGAAAVLEPRCRALAGLGRRAAARVRPFGVVEAQNRFSGAAVVAIPLVCRENGRFFEKGVACRAARMLSDRGFSMGVFLFDFPPRKEHSDDKGTGWKRRPAARKPRKSVKNPAHLTPFGFRVQ